jgi:adenosylcobinamide-GDP ribazoletransferase
MHKSDRSLQLWLAFVLLSRLPLPHLPKDAFSQGAKAVWAYPVVGLAIGVIGAVIGQMALLIGLSPFISATLAICSMVLATGAMHEDGLADVFDGFWGGFEPTRRLEIMRDSQIGTYGVLALGIVTLLRIATVADLQTTGWLPLIAAAAISRAVMPVYMYALPHARNDGLSHSVGKPTLKSCRIAVVVGVFALLICLEAVGIIALIVVTAVTAGLIMLARHKIGGQTGDVLGAAQQLTEVAILLTCSALL